MHLQQWTSGKSNHLLVALTLVFWWGGYSLPRYNKEVSIASGGLRIAEDAAYVSAGERRPVTNDGRRIVLAKPTDEFPRPTESQVCGALNGFYLSLSRKPRPDDVPSPLTTIAWLYPVKDSDWSPSQPVDRRPPFHRPDAYLRNCALLI
jgi:hypothetical protein